MCADDPDIIVGNHGYYFEEEVEMNLLVSRFFANKWPPAHATILFTLDD